MQVIIFTFEANLSSTASKAVEDAIETTKQNLKTRKSEKFIVILTSQ